MSQPSAPGGGNTLTRFSGSLSIESGRRMKLDAAELNLRLLLTDKVILHTHRLLEVNDLIGLFGVKGLMALLESDKLGLTCEAFSFGFRHDLAKSEDEFLIVNVWGHVKDRDRYVNTSFRENVMAGGGTRGLSKDIKRYIEPGPGEENSSSVRSHLHGRLINDHVLLRKAIVLAGAASGLAPGLYFDRLDVTVVQCTPGTLHYKITTNLPTSLSVVDRREIISSAISAIATAGLRVDEMRRHDALVEFKESDLPFLGSHLEFVSNAQPVEQLRRTLTLTGAPVPSQGSRIKADALIKAAGSPEGVQFRRWLQTDAPNRSDSEIQEQFGSWSESYRIFFGAGIGRHLKFLAFTAAGLALSPAAGVALAVLDFYLLDRLLKPSGHVLFLNQTYRSVFEKPEPQEDQSKGSSRDSA